MGILAFRSVCRRQNDQSHSEANREVIDAGQRARRAQRAANEAAAIVIPDKTHDGKKFTWRIWRIDERGIVVDRGAGEGEYLYYTDVPEACRCVYRRLVSNAAKHSLESVVKASADAEARIMAAVKGLRL
jgi:hypothetical protein